MALQPFELLLDLEKKSLTYAKPLPKQKVMAKAWQGIGFLVHDTYFVAPLQEILEVLSYPLVTNLLGSKAWFHGFTNLRGSLLPIVDLQGFMTKKETYATLESRVLVAKIDHIKVGFVVPRVLGIKKFKEETIKSNIKQDVDEFAPYILGTYQEDSKVWKVLSFKKIIEQSDFYHVLREEGIR